MDSRLLTGTVDMLILEVVAGADSYGYQIAQTVLSRSAGRFELKEGSLYPALHRLQRQKMLTGYWVDTEEGRRRKYYRITARGKTALKAKRDEWDRFAAGVRGILGSSHVVA